MTTRRGSEYVRLALDLVLLTTEGTEPLPA